ncbi:uncharacterized protein N7483_004244 [Penicillium malachiteum]|uniref:uncharacterized protein n=1 Tax=Penicillium malachiteum TaxID=1324776 RepID=UPI002547EA92|nr:uncharacterized protein N7483_004244 [Penicillium malachiteum]KAJ5729736.1 hypothetical protein N7483_004244 [Penicillium malachiteum]
MESSSAYSALTQNRFFTQHLLRALSQPDPPPKIQSNSLFLRCLNCEAESYSLPITQPAEQRVGDLTTALAQTLRAYDQRGLQSTHRRARAIDPTQDAQRT